MQYRKGGQERLVDAIKVKTIDAVRLSRHRAPGGARGQERARYRRAAGTPKIITR